MDEFQESTFLAMDAAIQGRQHVGPKHLVAPGPNAQTLERLLNCAAAAPDHEQLRPWRFLVLGPQARQTLADAFAAALLARDASATEQQLQEARDKAFRGPCLLLAIADLSTPHPAVPDAEKLVSLGCAIQNLLLGAHAMGYASGLISGKALGSEDLRAALHIGPLEQAVCFISIGTLERARKRKARPQVKDFVRWLP